MLAMAVFVSTALSSCGGGGDDDAIETPVTPPGDNGNNNNNTPTNSDPEGTQDMALKVGNANSVVNGVTGIDAQYNLTGGMVVSLGKIDGLGAITSIPTTGWQTKAPVNIGSGYVVYNEATEVFCRLYIVGQDGEGYHVKYQVPFRGTEQELMFSTSEVSFPAEGGTQELIVANSSITPFTVTSSETWCEVEKIQPGTGVRITCKPSAMGYVSNATITLTQTLTEKSKVLTVTREGIVHNAVDLGLSVQWCDRNVGASSVEGIGGYFAWGETEPKESFSWETYAYGSSETNVTDIGANISGTQYDAATKMLGDGWRMPTRAEIIELIYKCTWEKTSLNGVNGLRATAANGQSIFFAQQGGRISYGEKPSDATYFYGWVPNRCTNKMAYAQEYYFGDSGRPIIGTYGAERKCGMQVRAVKGEPYSDAESHYTKSGTVSGHDYVDLGLSVKWATCNLDAVNPWDYGGYYAWTTSKSDWGSSWRMPTKDELAELLTCKLEWTIFHNTGGYRRTGPNGRSIFLPAADMKFNAGDKDDAYDIDLEANYWSSSYNKDSQAHSLNLSCDVYTYGHEAYFMTDLSKTRYFYSIRLVTEEGKSESGQKGTAANPFTPAEAKAYGSTLAADAESAQDYYIKGRVHSMVEQFGTQYGNATFYLSDKEPFSTSWQWADDAFYVYRANYLGNTKYAGQSLLLNEGDEVVVCGKITNYKGDTPETVQGKAYVVSINGTTRGARTSRR